MTSEDKQNKNNQENFNKENLNHAKLILFNDDKNSFEYVIKSLMDLCAFENTQAEQIAIIAHFKGKATVKTGDKLLIASLKEQLEEAGLIVEIG